MIKDREEICITNEKLKETVDKLKKMGYKYIVKANDKMLGNCAYVTENKKHIQLIACYDTEELNAIKRDVENDDTFNYIDWNYINNYKSIYNWTKDKSFTIRNDWARAFK